METRSSGNKVVVLRFQELEVGPLSLGSARRLAQPAACPSTIKEKMNGTSVWKLRSIDSETSP